MVTVLQPILFADDTTISVSDSSEESLINKINNELYKIQQWTICNRLSINANKSELLLVTKRRVDRNQFNVFLGDDKIELESYCKFLGVFVDESLNFGKHVEHVLGKISKNTGILFRIRDSLPMDARLGFYYAFIFPYLSYNK